MSNELYHHGILGQKWGVRRYQNSDGTLTTAGRERYGRKPLSDRDIEKIRKLSIGHGRKGKDNTEKIFKQIGLDKKQSKQIANDVRSLVKEYTQGMADIHQEAAELFKNFPEGLEYPDDKRAMKPNNVACVAEAIRKFDEKQAKMKKDAKDFESGKYNNADDLTYDAMDANYLYYQDHKNDKFTTKDMFLAITDLYANGNGYDKINDRSVYADRNNLISKIKELDERKTKLSEVKEKAAYDMVQKTLDDIGNEKLSYVTHSSEIVQGLQHINNGSINVYGRDGLIDMAKKAEFFTNDDRKRIKTAERLLDDSKYNNLSLNYDNCYWGWLNKAVEDLNIGSKPAEDLTAADWKRINNRIKMLKASENY